MGNPHRRVGAGCNRSEVGAGCFDLPTTWHPAGAPFEQCCGGTWYKNENEHENEHENERVL